MAVSKVVVDGEAIVDLTSSTVAADNLLSGYTAFGADGEQVTGTVSVNNYAECSTARNVAAKVVECEGFVLETGVAIAVRFTDTTSSNPASGNITIDINGTGAKTIYRGDISTTIINYSYGVLFSSNHTALLLYNGESYVYMNYYNNTTYSPMSLGFGYGTCATAAATVAKVATLSSYNIVKNGIVAVKFSYAVPANATLNINSKGAKNIFYRGAKIVADVIGAGDIATFIYDGTQYQLLSIDRAQENTVTGIKGDAETEFRNGNVNITKANIGLVNVDNTSDADKPISTAQAAVNAVKQDLLCTAASGNPIAFDNLQGGVPFNSIHVSGKNLLSMYPAYPATLLCTIDADNKITITGTATRTMAYTITYGNIVLSEAAIISCTYTTNTPTWRVTVRRNGSNIYPALSQTGALLQAGDIVQNIFFNVAANTVVDVSDLAVQLEYGSTVTTYEPPISGRELVLCVRSKNLIPYDLNLVKSINTAGTWVDNTYTHSGITYMYNSDGTITVSGTATSASAFYLRGVPLKSGTYTASGCAGGSTTTYRLQLANSDFSAGFGVYNGSDTRTFTGDVNLTICRLIVAAGCTVTNLTVSPQLEVGDTATVYETSTGTVCYITPDANPYAVTTDVRQVNDINNVWVFDNSNPTLTVSANRTNPQLKMLIDRIDNLTTAVIAAGTE